MTTQVSDSRRLSVGIGQLAASSDPAEVLIAYGLGSCVGMTAWDPVARVGGLIHVLLPAAEGSRPATAQEPARFAAAGVDEILRKLTQLGGVPSRLVVKLAGGAAVLGSNNAERFKIGERNAEALFDRLKHHGLRPAATDLGGVKGRTLELHIATGKTFVRMAASPSTEL